MYLNLIYIVELERVCVSVCVSVCTCVRAHVCVGEEYECGFLSNGGLNSNPCSVNVHFVLLNGKTARESDEITPMCWRLEINTAAGLL